MKKNVGPVSQHLEAEMSCGTVGILGILPKTDRYLQGQQIVYSVPPFNENTARDMTIIIYDSDCP